MNLIIVFGPPAVGKMTVGQELARLTGYKLFHNHITLDMVTPLFPFGTPECRQLGTRTCERSIIAHAAQSSLPGLIFTYNWALDFDPDREFIDELRELVAANGGNTYYVELEADFDERLRRNRTPQRQQCKNYGDVDALETTLRQWQREYKLNSQNDFFYPQQHVKINNTRLSPDCVAAQVASAFGWHPA